MEVSRAKHFKVEWWKESSVYQIYPRSFFDSNRDGIGDLQGIISKVDYFVDLGVDAIWLSPIFASPMKDFGYDISNFLEIDPIFGTMKDLQDLVATFHSKGLKILLDFVPNHTSNEHEWFKKSVQKHHKYSDYYVWKDAAGFNDSGPIPPNNWLSLFRNSAWEWSEERQQFYLHQFLKEQPDLNYRNKNVCFEMENVLKFWLSKGIDGFRVDAVKHLVEAENVYEAMEPISKLSTVTDPTQYDYLDHIYTTDMPETFDILRQWRKILDQYANRVLFAEADGDVTVVMKYYGSLKDPLVDFPFNFGLISAFRKRSDVSGEKLKSCIEMWMNNMPDGKTANWVLGNHDNKRVATRLGADLVDAMNMILLLLPGTSVTYQGEEIGLEDTAISFEDTHDPFGLNFGPDQYANYSRDPERAPMQWNSSTFAGFTESNSSWLPVNKNYLSSNVKLQSEMEQSHLKVYKQLTKLRKNITFRKGSLSFPLVNEDIFSFVRSCTNATSYLVVVNTSLEDKEADFLGDDGSLPVNATVQIRSSMDTRLQTKPGGIINLSSVSLLAGEGLVLEFDQS